MKILVLGDSDTSGKFTSGKSWPGMVRHSLEAAGRPVELVSVGLAVTSNNAVPYVGRRVAETAPDIVVLVLGSFGFTAKFTWTQIEHLFGNRAGRWYRQIEEAFDSGTRAGDGHPRRVNLAARWVASRAIKKRPLSTRPKVTAAYREIFRTLARAEDCEVVVMVYPGAGQHARVGNAPRERAIFFADLKAAAETHHYRWIDTTELFADHLDETRVDDLHFNEAGHCLIANAMLRALETPLGTASNS